jgi:DNA-binding CsgD family transcriptional regulator/PAS domain-containing protein
MEQPAARSGPPATPGALSLAEYDALVAQVYQGPIEAIPWSGALNQLRRYLVANWITLTLRPASANQPGLIVLAGEHGVIVAPDSFSSSYAFALDPFINLPGDRVVTVDETLGEQQWTSSEFYKQFVEPHDIRYMTGADIRTVDGVDCRLRICRPASGRQFSTQDKALCQFLLPHLRRAVHLHSHLDLIKSERELYAATVNSMLVGAVIFDESGAIMKINRVAEEILADKDGIELLRGMLQADYSNENHELQRLIKQALAPESRRVPRVSDAISLTRPSGRAKLGVMVRAIPLSAWSEGRHRPAVAVFVRDPERKSQASADVMRRLFDFTPSEAALALQLANGRSLDEAADELDIRKNTARAHLRAIFSKTGVTRQTTLVHVLLNSVISLQ